MRIQTVGFIAATILFINLAFYAFIIWVAGSLITSSVKKGVGDCGGRYPIEAVFAGNLFCSEGK